MHMPSEDPCLANMHIRHNRLRDFFKNNYVVLPVLYWHVTKCRASTCISEDR